MEYWILIFILILIIVFILFYYSGKRIVGGSQDFMCEKTQKYINKFLKNELTDKKIIKINKFFNQNKDNIVLDLILHSYIYKDYPNKISRKAILDDIKNLKSKDYCHNASEVISLAKSILDTHSQNEIKIELKPDECFRNYKISELINPYELKNCEKEKSNLQEKIYDLRKDLEKARLSTLNSFELEGFKYRLEDCQRQNAMINNELQRSRREYNEREFEIKKITQDLNDCHMIVNALSNQ